MVDFVVSIANAWLPQLTFFYWSSPYLTYTVPYISGTSQSHSPSPPPLSYRKKGQGSKAKQGRHVGDAWVSVRVDMTLRNVPFVALFVEVYNNGYG